MTYRHHGAQRASSRSVATKIVEIGESDRGFMWRLNAYWRYEQVPGGVIVELESMTLSRAVPFGLTAVVRPIIDRIAASRLDGRWTASVRSTARPHL